MRAEGGASIPTLQKSAERGSTPAGTTEIVKNYHFTETRGANLTDADGNMLQCAPPTVGGALAAADGGALSTKSADLDAEGGVLTRPSGASLAVTGATARVGTTHDSTAAVTAPVRAVYPTTR